MDGNVAPIDKIIELSEKYRVDMSKEMKLTIMDNFKNHRILSKGDLILTINTRYSSENYRNFYFHKDLDHFYHLDFSSDDIRIEFNGLDLLTHRLLSGDFLGSISIFHHDNLIEEFNFYLEDEITFSLISFIYYHRLIFIIGLGSGGIIIFLIIIYKRKR